MTIRRRVITTVAGVAAGIAIIGGAAAANADTTTSADSKGTTQQSDTQCHGGGEKHRRTPVTGDEATKVGDAVKAKDAAASTDKVFKRADGSYDVLATKGDKHTHFRVSADLKTVTEKTRGGHGKGGHGQGKGRPAPGEAGPGEGGPRPEGPHGEGPRDGAGTGSASPQPKAYQG
ncbi:hypothetical protein KEM60_02968 [Austwickia sp. TVS 96-490-7B]|uniref:hypothetical protein n=1 Tax=Austwickia sp. TVS 96-490-7B TaxID=2830843 RepID=UPI001C593234|nr:hypothetical protein [Austwickia sp. TVS 96-490-7B]MBW3086739.1 hypothetical protein [Austwickia sp. TVS 96-490-7B]